MESTLEISVQPDDEWLDVTTKEALLANEVTQLREALSTRTKELELANEKVTELESHKIALENERKTLQIELELSTGELVTVEKKLEDCNSLKEAIEKDFIDFKETSVAHVKSMDQSLSTARNDLFKTCDRVLTLQAEIKDMKSQSEKERQKFQNEIKEIKAQNEKEKREARLMHKEEIISREKEMKEVRSLLAAVRKELESVKQENAMKKKEIDVAHKQLGSVAILAEDRKDVRVSLERAVAQNKFALNHAGKDLQQCYAEIASLRSELSEVKAASDKRIRQLEESLGTKHDELQDAVDELMTKDLSLAEKVEDLQSAHQQIEELGTVVKNATRQAVALKEELEETQANEKALQEELQKQKDSYEHRLDEIRDALGIKKASQPSKPIIFPFLNLPSHIKLV